MTDEFGPPEIPTDVTVSWASGDAPVHRLQSDVEQVQLPHDPHRSIIASHRVHSTPELSGRRPIWGMPGSR
jgi:hypothetical protein